MEEESCRELAFLDTFSINTNKDDENKKKTKKQRNTRMKQVFKKNGCHESIGSRIFKRITNNHNLSRSEQKSQRCQIKDQNWYKFT